MQIMRQFDVVNVIKIYVFIVAIMVAILAIMVAVMAVRSATERQVVSFISGIVVSIIFGLVSFSLFYCFSNMDYLSHEYEEIKEAFESYEEIKTKYDIISEDEIIIVRDKTQNDMNGEA